MGTAHLTLIEKVQDVSYTSYTKLKTMCHDLSKTYQDNNSFRNGCCFLAVWYVAQFSPGKQR